VTELRTRIEDYTSSLSAYLRNIKIVGPLKEKLSEVTREHKEIYEESGISLYYDDYIKRLIIVAYFVFALTTLATFIIHNTFFSLTESQLFTVSIVLSLSTTILTFLIGLIYPVYKGSQFRSSLENNIVYSLSYMAVLSSSGMPIERIFKRVSEIEDNPPLNLLTHKFLINVNMFGVDILNALREMANRSPSKTLAKQIESIRTTIMTSGDLKTLLIYEVERQLQKKKEILKNNLATLVYLGEIYVTLMVVMPVLFILMITILSIMGGRSFGGSSITQLNLIIFFGIPVMAAAFIIILDQVLVIEE
jgi:flagellar protein FlaJ